jgi:hypothetical protein
MESAEASVRAEKLACSIVHSRGSPFSSEYVLMRVASLPADTQMTLGNDAEFREKLLETGAGVDFVDTIEELCKYVDPLTAAAFFHLEIRNRAQLVMAVAKKEVNLSTEALGRLVNS